MSKRRFFLILLLVNTSIAMAAPWTGRVEAAMMTFCFTPPATDPDKNLGPGDVPGWGALVLMFTGPVTSAKYMIDDSPCPNFMDVPGFTGPADTVTIVPPPAPGSPLGYRIPVGKKVTLMVTSDAEVMLKPGAGSPPTPSFWRYKGNNADVRNLPATAIPEPSTTMLVMVALAALLAGSRHGQKNFARSG